MEKTVSRSMWVESDLKLTRRRWKRFQRQDCHVWQRLSPTTTPSSMNTSLIGILGCSLRYSIITGMLLLYLLYYCLWLNALQKWFILETMPACFGFYKLLTDKMVCVDFKSLFWVKSGNPAIIKNDTFRFYLKTFIMAKWPQK